MNRSLHRLWTRLGSCVSGAVLAIVASTALMAADLPTRAPNFGSVANTRHNMTQSYLGGGAGWMNLSRNNYGEVCVYCHTPHGASSAPVPLWNRTQVATNYQIFTSSTASQPIGQPGANSLSCLSCHDGQTAIDSIINMPGSGRYLAGQATEQSTAFLDAWPGGPGSSFWGGHGTLEVSAAAFNRYGECQSCHSVSGDQNDPSTITSFDVFYIGTDLRNDHPVGVRYPNVFPNSDFKEPTAVRGNLRFFDTNGNQRADVNEVRLYDTGDSHEVECASCHDPHGVPTAGPGSTFTPSFLRKSNAGSAMCLTCHTK
jgi:hypothetical protein